LLGALAAASAIVIVYVASKEAKEFEVTVIQVFTEDGKPIRVATQERSGVDVVFADVPADFRPPLQIGITKVHVTCWDTLFSDACQISEIPAAP
jgi:hypothetical protein